MQSAPLQLNRSSILTEEPNEGNSDSDHGGNDDDEEDIQSIDGRDVPPTTYYTWRQKRNRVRREETVPPELYIKHEEGVDLSTNPYGDGLLSQADIEELERDLQEQARGHYFAAAQRQQDEGERGENTGNGEEMMERKSLSPDMEIKNESMEDEAAQDVPDELSSVYAVDIQDEDEDQPCTNDEPQREGQLGGEDLDEALGEAELGEADLGEGQIASKFTVQEKIAISPCTSKQLIDPDPQGVPTSIGSQISSETAIVKQDLELPIAGTTTIPTIGDGLTSLQFGNTMNDKSNGDALANRPNASIESIVRALSEPENGDRLYGSAIDFSKVKLEDLPPLTGYVYMALSNQPWGQPQLVFNPSSAIRYCLYGSNNPPILDIMGIDSRTSGLRGVIARERLYFADTFVRLSKQRRNASKMSSLQAKWRAHQTANEVELGNTKLGPHVSFDSWIFVCPTGMVQAIRKASHVRRGGQALSPSQQAVLAVLELLLCLSGPWVRYDSGDGRCFRSKLDNQGTNEHMEHDCCSSYLPCGRRARLVSSCKVTTDKRSHTHGLTDTRLMAHVSRANYAPRQHNAPSLMKTTIPPSLVLYRKRFPIQQRRPRFQHLTFNKLVTCFKKRSTRSVLCHLRQYPPTSCEPLKTR